MQRSQREVSKPPHHQSFSSCSSRVSICFWPILHLRLICSSTKSVLFAFESRTVFFAVGLSFCGQLDCGLCIQVRFCAGKRSECVIHPLIHTLRSPLRQYAHRYSVCLAKDTHCTRQETSRQAIEEFDENSMCDHRICQRCSGTLTCDSLPHSRPQRDKRLTSACCPLISLRIETQWTSLNARVLWPVLSKGAEILRLTRHHSRC